MNKPKLWTKNFLIITAANFFLYFTFYLLMVTMSLFASERFHATPSEAGLASGIFIIGTLISRIFSGRHIERIGCKRMLYIGFTLFLITTCLYILVNSMAMLLLNRFLNGASMGIASTATGTIVSKIIPSGRRGEGTGYYTLSLTLAAAIGPFLGMLISENASFYMNFVVCIAFLVVSFIAVFFVEVPKLEFAKKQLKKEKESFSIHNFLEIKAVPISIISALVAFGYASILTFLTPYVKEINLTYAGSFFFIFYAVFVFISRPFVGKWLDTKGENFVMYPAILIFAIALFIISVTSNGLILLLAGALVGIGYGTVSSSCVAIAIKISPKHKIGLANSTSFIFQDLGVGFGPFILGLFISPIGYRGLYLMMAVVVAITMLLYYFLHGRNNVCEEDIREEISF
jgi:MFS family permease